MRDLPKELKQLALQIGEWFDASPFGHFVGSLVILYSLCVPPYYTYFYVVPWILNYLQIK